MNSADTAALRARVAELEEENARLQCAVDDADRQYRRAAQQLQAIHVIAGQGEREEL